jgi:Holliday junction resolvase RusA-like endonuclease
LDIEFLKDLLQKGNIVENDRQFVHQEAWKGIDRENPRVIFTIYPAKAGCCAG